MNEETGNLFNLDVQIDRQVQYTKVLAVSLADSIIRYLSLL
jgi:hypothetical protein